MGSGKGNQKRVSSTTSSKSKKKLNSLENPDIPNIWDIFPNEFKIDMGIRSWNEKMDKDKNFEEYYDAKLNATLTGDAKIIAQEKLESFVLTETLHDFLVNAPTPIAKNIDYKEYVIHAEYEDGIFGNYTLEFKTEDETIILAAIENQYVPNFLLRLDYINEDTHPMHIVRQLVEITAPLTGH